MNVALVLSAVVAAHVLAQETTSAFETPNLSSGVTVSPLPSSDDDVAPTFATPTDDSVTPTGLTTLQTVPDSRTETDSLTSHTISTPYNNSTSYNAPNSSYTVSTSASGAPSPSANSTSSNTFGSSGLPPQPTVSTTRPAASSVPTAGAVSAGLLNTWLGLGVGVAIAALQL